LWQKIEAIAGNGSLNEAAKFYLRHLHYWSESDHDRSVDGPDMTIIGPDSGKNERFDLSALDSFNLDSGE